MINWIQKNFHADKWWGKIIFTVLIYVLYWCIFYGSWFLLPDEFFLSKNSISSDFYGYLIAIFLFLFIPILSFFIPYLIKKTFKINKIFLYILHIVLIIFSILLFLHIALTISISHWYNF